jgi:hypothetical protein
MDGAEGLAMDPAEFADWLSGIAGLSGEQIAVALTELGEFARRNDEAGGRPSPSPTRGGVVDRKGRSAKGFEERAGRVGDDRRAQDRAPRLRVLRRRRDCRLGSVARLAEAPLQGVRAHFQRRDRDGDGPVAQEGSLA